VLHPASWNGWSRARGREQDARSASSPYDKAPSATHVNWVLTEREIDGDGLVTRVASSGGVGLVDKGEKRIGQVAARVA
jgi:hypothetical protein